MFSVRLKYVGEGLRLPEQDKGGRHRSYFDIWAEPVNPRWTIRRGNCYAVGENGEPSIRGILGTDPSKHELDESGMLNGFWHEVSIDANIRHYLF
jgi:hypothetical protein